MRVELEGTIYEVTRVCKRQKLSAGEAGRLGDGNFWLAMYTLPPHNVSKHTQSNEAIVYVGTEADVDRVQEQLLEKGYFNFTDTRGIKSPAYLTTVRLNMPGDKLVV